MVDSSQQVDPFAYGDTLSMLNAPQQPKGKKGLFRSKKDEKTGKVTRFPLFGKKKISIPVQENQTYSVKDAYLAKGFQSDFSQYADAVNGILKNLDGSQGQYQQILANIRAIHNTILKGMNLETFHDLLLANPGWEKYFMDNAFNIRDSKGNTIPLANLKIFNGTNQMPIVNILRTNGDKQNVFNMGRLEVIPITPNIYMSLSTKGGFYYRDGDILVPLERLTEIGFIKMSEQLASQQFLDTAKQVITNFNGYVRRLDATGAVPPDTVIGVQPGDSYGIFSQANGGSGQASNNGQQSAGNGGDRDKNKFRPTAFLNSLRLINKVSGDRNRYPTMLGRMNIAGYNPGNQADVANFVNGVDAFALLNGTTPDKVINLLNDANPTDNEERDINEVTAFVRDMSNPNVRERYYDAMVKAFAAMNDIPSSVIPSDNAENFYAKVINNDNDPQMHIYKQLWDQFITNTDEDYIKRRTNQINLFLGGGPSGSSRSSDATRESGYYTGSTSGNAGKSNVTGEKWSSGNSGGTKQTSGSGRTTWDQSQYNRDPYNYGSGFVNYGTIRNDHTGHGGASGKKDEKWHSSGNDTGSKQTYSSANKGNGSTGEKWSSGQKTTSSGSSSSSSSFSSSSGGNENTVELGSQIRLFANTKPIYGSGYEEVRKKMQQRLQKASNGDIGGALRRATEYINNETGSSVSPTRVSTFIEDFMESGKADPRSYFPDANVDSIDGGEIVDAFNRALGGVDLYVSYGGYSGYDSGQYNE